MDFSKMTMPRFKTEAAQKEYEKALTEFYMIYFATDEQRQEYLESHAGEMSGFVRESIKSGLKWGEKLPTNLVMGKQMRHD